MYKAKNIDIEKAEKYLLRCINDSMLKENCEKRQVEKYHEGYREGINTAMNMFYCSNYEKDKEDE